MFLNLEVNLVNWTHRGVLAWVVAAEVWLAAATRHPAAAWTGTAPRPGAHQWCRHSRVQRLTSAAGEAMLA